jgi:hypothetical protein
MTSFKACAVTHSGLANDETCQAGVCRDCTASRAAAHPESKTGGRDGEESSARKTAARTAIVGRSDEPEGFICTFSIVSSLEIDQQLEPGVEGA